MSSLYFSPCKFFFQRWMNTRARDRRYFFFFFFGVETKKNVGRLFFIPDEFFYFFSRLLTCPCHRWFTSGPAGSKILDEFWAEVEMQFDLIFLDSKLSVPALARNSNRLIWLDTHFFIGSESETSARARAAVGERARSVSLPPGQVVTTAMQLAGRQRL